MLENHPFRFPDLPRHEVDPEEFQKLLSRNNNSCPDPDRITFSFFRQMKDYTLDAWVAAIQGEGEDVLWEDSFGDASMVLIPKTSSSPLPEQHRPISVTNSDYRIITRDWALWLAGESSQTIEEEQFVLVKGRSIETAVESVADGFLERVATGREAYLLQTDFYKAFDCLNREAIHRILEALQVPRQIRAMAKKALQPSKVSLACDPKCEGIRGIIGVKQGCPISPLIFCIIMEPLIFQAKKTEDVDIISAYMDDLGIMMVSQGALGGLQEAFEDHQLATGVKLNYDECTILSNREITTRPRNGIRCP